MDVNRNYGMLLPMFPRTTKAVILKLVELRLEMVNRVIYSYLSFLRVNFKVSKVFHVGKDIPEHTCDTCSLFVVIKVKRLYVTFV